MIPRIFIVDDEAPARARLRMLLSDIAAECPHSLVGEAGHAQAALEGIAATLPDVVLMDVQMPEITGLQLAERLMQVYAKGADAALHAPAELPIIIFVTAYDHYAVNAFDVHAFDYLLKPVRAERLQQAITRAAHLRAQTHIQKPLADGAGALPRAHFSVQERGRVLLVPVSEVLFLKAELKYVALRTKAREYLIEDSLISIEEELADYFVRVHRNTLVARNAIVGVERGVHLVDGEGRKLAPALQDTWQVILRDVDQRLPISRRQWGVIRGLVR